jgi:hypothetical protein
MMTLSQCPLRVGCGLSKAYHLSGRFRGVKAACQIVGYPDSEVPPTAISEQSSDKENPAQSGVFQYESHPPLSEKTVVRAFLAILRSH